MSGPIGSPETRRTEELPAIALACGLRPETELAFHGRDKAKVRLAALDRLEAARPPGKLILVSAITPTPAGEGKTTVSIGLAQGLKATGRSAALALRQPSMGPVFGRKGGATGGGRSRLIPEDELNLHFTGDFHAVASAHNLLAAAIDNRLHFGDLPIARDSVTWKRVMDVNDRALRRIRIAVGDAAVERDTGFDITAASEIMAVLCLAQSMEELRARLDRMVIGIAADGTAVTAGEVGITGSLVALLRDAMLPNLVRSIEGVPAFVHGGPFANIAHGCNSILATRLARVCGEFAVTEAGFAFDLGGEKFLDLKCRAAGFVPDAVVLVATLRALKMHGGVPLDELTGHDQEAIERGLANLSAHLDAVAEFGLPVVVALNRFEGDREDEESVVRKFCEARGVRFAAADIFAQGGEGGRALAGSVIEAAAEPTPPFRPLYPLEGSIEAKIDAIATRIYGAEGVDFTDTARARLRQFESHGLAVGLPVCMAKTPQSLSDNPKQLGRPRGFRITVRDFELARGAGFVIALTGSMVRMPALPRRPAAERIDVDRDGRIAFS